MNKVAVATLSELEDRTPAYALAANVDLVVVRYDDRVSVLYGRCLHRGALMSDGHVDGDNLICGLHGWDYRLDSGISEYANSEVLRKFECWVEDGKVVVDEDEIAAWEADHPQPYRRDDCLGLYADIHGDPAEPHVKLIQEYARNGLDNTGHHGVVEAMGVPRDQLPTWDDIQFVTAQLHRPPGLDDDPVASDVVIGPNAQKPLHLEIPLFVSDMSFGALSEPAKVALARGAQLAGTGICSGEGGMLPEEQRRQRTLLLRAGVGPLRLFLGQAQRRPGLSLQGRPGRQDRHRRPPARPQGEGQDRRGARPCRRRTRRLARPLSPTGRQPGCPDPEFADEVRDRTGGIPIGYKLSAQHIEKDIDAALEVGVDYVILDGRGGGTGAAPIIFRDTYLGPDDPGTGPGPTRHLDRLGRSGDVTLIITGGLRKPADFAKAMALGADGSPCPTPPSRRSAAWACAPATPTTARSGSRPSSRTWSPG